ncbi:hypothetical protein Psi01_82660 [Planobispora siamensis]|uniref:SIS domain-containing protein n=1 Tax=Planobispora siamensis TaxID=936338 RepID=A0A8J3WS80_9ACTN|nr:hypothetical protein Psi01_82660 [Planobispora siamensis]
MGTSAAPAADAAYRLTAIGCRAGAPADGRTRQLRASLLDEDDVIVAVSRTGRGAERLAAVDAARSREAKIVAIDQRQVTILRTARCPAQPRRARTRTRRRAGG